MLGDVQAVFAQVFDINTFHMDEWAEVDLQLVLLCQLCIRILFRFGSRLRDEYCLSRQGSKFLFDYHYHFFVGQLAYFAYQDPNRND